MDQSYALVAYLPEPLASFLEHLRQDMEPGCRLRSHLTILPPRKFSQSLEEVVRNIEGELQSAHAFSVDLGDVHVFPISQAIHLDVVCGFQQVVTLHDLLNCDGLQSPEAFPFHPHVTLAQNLTPEANARASGLAKERWGHYAGCRKFVVDHLTLVQNIAGDDCWSNLRDFALRVPVSA